MMSRVQKKQAEWPAKLKPQWIEPKWLRRRIFNSLAGLPQAVRYTYTYIHKYGRVCSCVLRHVDIYICICVCVYIHISPVLVSSSPARPGRERRALYARDARDRRDARDACDARSFSRELAVSLALKVAPAIRLLSAETCAPSRAWPPLTGACQLAQGAAETHIAESRSNRELDSELDRPPT